MCLILFAWQVHPHYPLILAANRDEFYGRPTAPAQFWPGESLLAGRDLQAGGTWLGITPQGRWAAVTNYRDPVREQSGARSRGELPTNFLRGAHQPEAYLQAIDRHADDYSGFNLLVGTADEVWYYSNIEKEVRAVPPGVHGLSNHLLNTPWPKVTLGKTLLKEHLDRAVTPAPDALLALLQNADRPGDTALPSTGVSLEWERALSTMFIATPTYGTRCSTVVLQQSEQVQFVERRYGPQETTPEEQRFAVPRRPVPRT
ncbi:Uncharacterized conserved protein, contains NRDE domain [Catalinimonas alkaloidigena]|uniref:Uncharacterized conserved protein, contains NRDE domain n=1 Tax=Catalinimonas alkaloidigena TaxID=1075417 RepID=A0A1G9LMS0_9BACT|nr:NRDE family protein [Catalinimonas alkaloidigena]SDL63153.1 Uncharacterized conserved protein, contains NRDE domain [Catalinimonas alkaloidigena]